MAIASVAKPTPYVALVEKINELSEDVETLRHSYQVYEKQAWEAREALQRANASFATQADENDRTVGKLRDTLKKAHDLLDWKAEHAASAVMAKIAEKEAFQIRDRPSQGGEVKKIKVMQRGREVEVYEWAMETADDICSKTMFAGMVMPDTDIQIYWALALTDDLDRAMEEAYQIGRAKGM